jgi:hypothetical protein
LLQQLFNNLDKTLKEMGVDGLTQKEAMLLLRALPSLQPTGAGAAASPVSPRPTLPPSPSTVSVGPSSKVDSPASGDSSLSPTPKPKSPRPAGDSKPKGEKRDRATSTGGASSTSAINSTGGTRSELKKLNEDLAAENAELQKKLAHMKSKTESLAKLQSKFSDSEKKRKRAEEDNAFAFMMEFSSIFDG